MRKFAFQELAYAIVVAASYGLIIGIYITSVIDLDLLIIEQALPLYIILWALAICMHLAGIYLLVKLEEKQEHTRRNMNTPSKKEQE
ncbi:MAG: hypothetical protein ACFFAE_08565 [Candidatus Hodarchaeota archaeon]